MSVAMLAAPAAPAAPAATDAATVVSVTAHLMGGRVGVHLRPGAVGSADAAWLEGARVLRRMRAWADRLTRFSDSSDLARLNAAGSSSARVRPTLAAVLEWSRRASQATGGIVDVTLLDARLAAEAGRAPGPGGADRSWEARPDRRGATIARRPGLRFDLDGVGKGWLADRAVALLDRHRAALVDADGDVAISLRHGETWRIGVAHPTDPGAVLATLELAGLAPNAAQRFGVATSGTSVHRWVRPTGVRHHLIDPRTERSAVTDVAQATVLAGSAAEAEAFAKAVVILGSEGALRLLDGPGLGGTLLLTERGEVLATPSLTRWLA
jgi:thiamine biosynthesis lipoprotein